MPVKLSSTGGGVTLTTPSTASDFTVTFPANTGNVVTTGSSAVVTQAMLGTNVAGNGPAFSAYLSADQTITSSTFTKVQLNAELFDTNSNFDTATNYRFTPLVAGYYQISGGLLVDSSATSMRLAIYKNGSNYKTIGRSNLSIDNTIAGSSVVYLNGSTDYVEIYVNKSGNSPVIFDFSSLGTLFNGVGVRS